MGDKTSLSFFKTYNYSQRSTFNKGGKGSREINKRNKDLIANVPCKREGQRETTSNPN